MCAPADFSGAWEALIGESAFRMPTPSSLRMWIAQRGDSIVHRVQTIWADGTERLAELEYQVGRQVEVEIGGQPAMVSARWDGATLVIDSQVGPPERQMRLSDHWSMSDDGAILTMAHLDDLLAGQVCVLRRVAE